MYRYFLKIVFLLCFFIIFRDPIFATIVLTTPPNGSNVPGTTILFEWENLDTSEDYIYRYEYSSYINFNMFMTYPRTTENNISVHLPTNRIFFWRVRYHPLSTFDGNFYLKSSYTSDVFVLGTSRDVPLDIVEEVEEINKKDVEEDHSGDIGYEEEETEDENEKEERRETERDTPTITPEDENIGNVNTPEEVENLPPPSIISQSFTPTSIEKDTLVSERFEWNISSGGSVLGSHTLNEIVCKFNVLKDDYEVVFCNIPELEIMEQFKYPLYNEFSTIIRGRLVSSFKIQIDEYICNFSILKPNTWFRCEKKLVKSNILNVTPNMFLHIHNGDRRVPVLSYNPNGDNFSLVAGYYEENNDLRLVHTYRIVLRDFNVLHNERRTYALDPVLQKESTVGKESKPFSFPFSRIIGVTQWYGNTAFQTPHTGIDFGSRKENVLAVSDGTVISKGWDSYFGECNSGGNFLRIRQENNMHTVYFHLDEIYVNTGDIVKRGDIVAKSGNTGAWNCQPLGYHLHFETRLSQSMNSHVNPVRYIDIDWHQVPTIGYKQFPGRLTGKNPHLGKQ